MLVCGRKTDGTAFRVKPRDHPTNKIPLSSVVERLAVNQEALIRYSDDRNVEGEPISNAPIAELVLAMVR